MGKHGILSIAYDCFIEGLTVEQAVERTKIKHGQMKTYYTNFIVNSAKIKANSNEDRLLQIGAIERELFSRIEKGLPVDELQNIYSRFNALK